MLRDGHAVGAGGIGQLCVLIGKTAGFGELVHAGKGRTHPLKVPGCFRDLRLMAEDDRGIIYIIPVLLFVFQEADFAAVPCRAVLNGLYMSCCQIRDDD